MRHDTGTKKTKKDGKIEILKDNLRLSIESNVEYDFGSYYDMIELKLMFADQEVCSNQFCLKK